LTSPNQVSFRFFKNDRVQYGVSRAASTLSNTKAVRFVDAIENGTADRDDASVASGNSTRAVEINLAPIFNIASPLADDSRRNGKLVERSLIYIHLFGTVEPLLRGRCSRDESEDG
jgi:hypothetical protein